MSRKKQKQIILSDLYLTAIAAEGQTIARHEGKVIFVEGGVPGDTVDVLVYKNKSDYAMARVLAIKQASADRVEPFCKHFGTCGGCKWQQLAYEKQAIYKQQLVEDAFKRIGKLIYPAFDPILAANPTQYYRNKLEFTFSNRRWFSHDEFKARPTESDAPVAESDEAALTPIAPNEVDKQRNALGFHVPGMFDRLVNIEHCYLQPEPSNAIRNAFYQFALAQGYTFYDVKNHVGLLRNLIVRTATTGETMLTLCLSAEATMPIINQCMAFLDTQFGEQITSLQYVINPKRNDTIYDLEVVTYKGRGYIFEQLDDLRYKISPKSFFQTNPHQTLRMYRTVCDMAQLKGNETVYDLYTGTGSIALFIARQCRQVVGIEEVADAIADAKINAQLNQIEHATFYAGDVRQLLNQALADRHGAPDVLITDPPRAGMHPDVVQQIIQFAPQRIVYVSCNPATQARDLQALNPYYAIERVQPIDMFPHTFHVENVVSLTKIN
jgi:23S rRNA (uracil1939-C5)-methyltransferase